MRSLKTSYLLMLPTLFGVAGLHRFYMGKVKTGLLWVFTWGLFGIGTIYDAVTMARQLSERDEEDTGEYIEPREYWARLSDEVNDPMIRSRIRQRHGIDSIGAPQARGGEALEVAALRLARGNGGYITPAQLSVETGSSPDACKAALDALSTRGMADIRIRRDGLVAYVFLDFLRPEIAREFESF